MAIGEARIGQKQSSECRVSGGGACASSATLRLCTLRLSHRADEPLQLLPIEPSVRAHAAADVDAGGAGEGERFGDVLGAKTAGEKDGHAGIGADAPADAPVVNASRAAELFDAQRRIAGIEQQRIDVAAPRPSPRRTTPRR